VTAPSPLLALPMFVLDDVIRRDCLVSTEVAHDWHRYATIARVARTCQRLHTMCADLRVQFVADVERQLGVVLWRYFKALDDGGVAAASIDGVWRVEMQVITSRGYALMWVNVDAEVGASLGVALWKSRYNNQQPSTTADALAARIQTLWTALSATAIGGDDDAHGKCAVESYDDCTRWSLRLDTRLSVRKLLDEPTWGELCALTMSGMGDRTSLLDRTDRILCGSLITFDRLIGIITNNNTNDDDDHQSCDERDQESMPTTSSSKQLPMWIYKDTGGTPPVRKS